MMPKKLFSSTYQPDKSCWRRRSGNPNPVTQFKPGHRKIFGSGRPPKKPKNGLALIVRALLIWNMRNGCGIHIDELYTADEQRQLKRMQPVQLLMNLSKVPDTLAPEVIKQAARFTPLAFMRAYFHYLPPLEQEVESWRDAYYRHKGIDLDKYRGKLQILAAHQHQRKATTAEIEALRRAVPGKKNIISGG